MNSISDDIFQECYNKYYSWIDKIKQDFNHLQNFKLSLDSLPLPEKMAIYFWIISRKNPVALLSGDSTSFLGGEADVICSIINYTTNYVKLKLKDENIFNKHVILNNYLTIANKFVEKGLDFESSLEVFNTLMSNTKEFEF